MPELVTPPPVQMNARRIVAVGTALWFVARHGHRGWLWTCLAGTVCGVLGWLIMSRHRRQGRTI